MSIWKKMLVMLVVLWGIIVASPTFFGDKLPEFFPDKTINLGLDLQGGSHLLLEVDTQVVINDALQDAKTGVAAALNKNGFAGANTTITENGFRYTVSEEKLADTRKLIRKTISYQGTFDREENQDFFIFSDAELNKLRTNAMQRTLQVIRMRVDETGTKEPSIQRQGDNRVLLQLPGVEDPGRLQELLGKTARLTFHLVDESIGIRGSVPNRGVKTSYQNKVLPFQGEENRYLVINRVAMLGGETLTGAQQTFQDARPVVSFTLNTQGGKKFGRITTDNVDKLFAIVLDDEVVSAPNIAGPIVGGSGVISGSFSVQEAQDLALLLRSGALPAPIKIIEERTVGPSLGQDSIEAGTLASMMGLLAVVVLIIIVYKVIGVFAALALFINLILLVALLATLGATLTLPGIAGIVLTIGMAVDANVLVFERIKEELRQNKKAISAVRDGYGRAFTTIMDANITTLIAAVILFSVGSGPVKGFAVTLGLGILSSLFTALLVTQWLMLSYAQSQNRKK